MKNPTQEEISKSISASFDSVNLIIELNALEVLDEEQLERKKANISHIKIMLAKEWFSESLTSTQKAELQSIIE